MSEVHLYAAHIQLLEPLEGEGDQLVTLDFMVQVKELSCVDQGMAVNDIDVHRWLMFDAQLPQRTSQIFGLSVQT